ncbi:MAG: fluoride efflux transporter CrcB [Actinomyces sp.]|nr:MAG: fluoride efflux transporter CrcB [Actinomyces sp.]
MATPVLFALAATVGAGVRWRMGLHLPRPLGTLVVNLCGAFLLGLIDSWSGAGATVAGTAGLGALTTFSTFADDLVELGRARPLLAVAYATATLAGGVLAAAAGLALG